MANTLAPTIRQKFFDNNGEPLSSGKLFTYAGGTVNTKLTSYKNSTGTTNTNPIILDARGECDLWIPPNVAYKFVLAPATDTDPPTNSFWTVDNAINNQLTTLYGGVDTGSANAYILTFNASFSSYSDGIVIYWIPAHNNTTASVVNVNGLGNISIVNLDGSALGANQIIANQMTEIVYVSGKFQLLSIGALAGAIIGTFGAESSIASAATTDLGSATAHVVNITGTTTITSFGSSASTVAPIYSVRFSGALTLTHNATSLILPGAANISVQAGDTLLAQYLGSGNWKVLSFQAHGLNDYTLAPLASPTFTGTPTAPTALFGTNTSQLATLAFANSAALGYATGGTFQSWSNVTGTRAVGTTYTNTTDIPIFISVCLLQIGLGSGHVEIDGINIGSVVNGASGNVAATISAIVPSQKTYKAVQDSGTTSIQSWAELK